MAIIYWLFLTFYLSTFSFSMFLLGINWCKIETKYKHSPQRLLILLYCLNAIILYYGFQIHIVLLVMISAFFICSVFMGSGFQCIGLTGGISTGKSTVSTILAENGFDIIDTDKISKEMDSDVGYQRAIRKVFGEEVFNGQGTIDREKLGQVIFKDAEKRKQLNKISHPRIFRKIIVQLFKLKFLKRKPLVVLDAPLLFEAKILEYVCYPIVVVYCEDGQIQLKRLMERNQLTEEDAIRKISSQMPINIKLKKSDIKIENGGTIKDLDKQVINKVIPQVYQKLGYIDAPPQ